MQFTKTKKAALDLFWSFQPLYFISRLLSINAYRYDKTFASITNSDKLYGYLVIVLTVAIMLLSILARILYTYSTLFLSMIILDFSISVLQVLLVLLSVWCAVKRHGNKMKSFFRKITKIDTMLAMFAKDYESERRMLGVKCAAITATTIVFAVAETFLCSKLYDPLLAVISTYSVKYLMFYYKFIIFMQVQTRVGVLKERFQHVNDVLSSNSETDKSNVLLQEISGRKEVAKIDLHTIFESHNVLCDLVDIVNDMHGFQILIIVCSIIVAILNLLNTGIILVLSAMFEDDQTDFQLQYAVLGIQGATCFGFVIMSILMAAQCSSTVDEANQTKAVAQKLLLETPIVTSEVNGERYMYREELILFINTSRSPAFSAGGFFTIDYTLLLAIMGAVTSYFIVLLQFANVKGNKIV